MFFLNCSVCFSTCFVDFFDDVYFDGQACGSRCFGHEIDNRLQIVEENSLANATYVAEHSPLNGVVFGTVGRVVRDADRDSNSIDDSLHVFLEYVCPTTVASAAVANDQDLVGIGGRGSNRGSPRK